jgi:hypothetical protein
MPLTKMKPNYFLIFSLANSTVYADQDVLARLLFNHRAET